MDTYNFMPAITVVEDYEEEESGGRNYRMRTGRSSMTILDVLVGDSFCDQVILNPAPAGRQKCDL